MSNIAYSGRRHPGGRLLRVFFSFAALHLGSGVAEGQLYDPRLSNAPAGIFLATDAAGNLHEAQTSYKGESDGRCGSNGRPVSQGGNGISYFACPKFNVRKLNANDDSTIYSVGFATFLDD